MKGLSQSSTRSHLISVLLLLILFSGMVIARWNQLYFYTPDSARYVIMAKSLVNGTGYREIDTPGEPLYAHRPPGMSLLLSPAALIAPYNVMGAKATVWLSGLAMLTLLYLYVLQLHKSEQGSFNSKPDLLYWPAILIAGMIAINPYTLFFSTLVMSEIPFMACSLAILYLLAVQTESPGKWHLACFTCLLIFLPFLRTIGIALVLAVGIWAIVRKTRWRWLIGVACSLLATGFWMFRNSALEKSGYTSVALQELKSQGVIGTVFNILQRSQTHFDSFCQKLFPDMPGAMPRYSRMILDENAILPGPVGVYLLLGAIVLALSCYGMIKRRRQGGTVALWYLIFSLGILSLWPWMQQRFTLPLLPVVLAFLPAGWGAFSNHFEVSRPLFRKILFAACSLLLLLLAGWQLKTDRALIDANLKMIRDPQNFYKDQLPPNQFSNWTAAGTWIRENTAPSARLITRRADIATTGHRFQKLNFFEITNAEQLHKEIQKLPADYLVTFSRDTVSAFPWHLLDQDLVYRMTPVYDKQGVMILKLEPNRSGTIRNQYWHPDDSLKLAKAAIEKFPHRLAFQVAYAQQLFATAHYDELIDYVGNLEQQQITDVRLTNLLAWSYIKTKQYQKSIREFERAFSMPDQKMLRRDLVRGINLAHDTLEASYQSGAQDEQPAVQSDQVDLQLAENYLRFSEITTAEQTLVKALKQSSAYPGSAGKRHHLLAKIYLAEGRKQEAKQQLNHAIASGEAEAPQTLHMLQLEEKIEHLLKIPQISDDAKQEHLTSESIQDVLTLVSWYQESGVPGKALHLLERANVLIPNQPEILRLLIQSQLFYAQTSDAEKTLIQLNKLIPASPNLEGIKQQIESLLRLPRF
ncbi:hypothetical protein [Gimesia sp.]|uniref:hypothetical protein n=1 Tax=Gimesia sp. TaxID=2024833 RepID=UPI003A8E86CC